MFFILDVVKEVDVIEEKVVDLFVRYGWCEIILDGIIIVDVVWIGNWYKVVFNVLID